MLPTTTRTSKHPALSTSLITSLVTAWVGGAAALVLASAPATAAAQEATSAGTAAVAGDSGMITGVITDERDAGLGGIVVALECACLRGPQERMTDENGVFVFDDLPPGKYTVKAFQAGNTTATRETDLSRGGFVQVDVTVEGAPPPAAGHHGHRHDDDDDDDDDDHHHHHALWGGVSVGLVFAPVRAPATLSPEASRITTNNLTPWAGPVRGIDVRWQTFDLDNDHFPRTIGYFRSGFGRGGATFKEPSAGFGADQPSALDVLTVPLFVGGNLYLFRDFPVRPYAGLGFGFDVMRLAYTREGGAIFSDVSARIGFEVHGGIEVRITNYFALTGEVTQLWSARRKILGLPDVSNESFTALIGVTGAFPLHRR